MILSPVITLKEGSAPHKIKAARGVFVGTLLLFAGLSILALAWAREAPWN
jgi:hypothetical protein